MAEQVIQKLWFFDKLLVQLFPIGLKHKTNFFRLLSVALQAGLGIRDALYSIRKSETHQWLVIVIDDIIAQLSKWMSLPDAMRNHPYIFATEEVALLESSQVIGNMPEILQDIAQELENMQYIKQKITKAVIYPLILIFFTIIAVVILLIYVVPTIVSLFPSEAELPALTRFMLSASSFLQYTRWIWPLVVLWIITLCKVLYESLLSFKIFVDDLVLHIPVVKNVVKAFYMYRFTKLLWQFYTAWLSSIVSLWLMKEVFSNFFYQKKALEIKSDLQSGFSFAESMEWSPLFDSIVVQIIALGEKTGNIGSVLLSVSEYYRRSLDTKLAILMTFIEPLLLAWIAIIIGIVIWSIFLPMADLVSIIQ